MSQQYLLPSSRPFVGIPAMMAFLAILPSPLHAGDYEKRVVVSGLVRPTGIVACGRNTITFTQLPTPGVAGPDGGMNSVDRFQISSGRTTRLTTGEPEPSHLAVSRAGNIYWTCKSAGVILERNRRGKVGLFLGGLDKPVGIAVGHSGEVYFTQVPTPGVPGRDGGYNTVNVSDGTSVEVLTLGEPEPTDIAVSSNGLAYWTCKSAGVILMRTTDGAVSLVRNELNNPLGIALDEVRKRLYFTEVPTPGVAGSDGGMNRVSVINLETGLLEVVDEGDPEPTDITVAPNGSILWTCSSAGVIVSARERR